MVGGSVGGRDLVSTTARKRRPQSNLTKMQAARRARHRWWGSFSISIYHADQQLVPLCLLKRNFSSTRSQHNQGWTLEQDTLVVHGKLVHCGVKPALLRGKGGGKQAEEAMTGCRRQAHLYLPINRSTKTTILGLFPLVSRPVEARGLALTAATAFRMVFIDRNRGPRGERDFSLQKFLPRAFIFPRASPAFTRDVEIDLTAIF